MENSTKVDWKPEDNNYLNRIFDKINLALGFIIILAPIITSLFCLCGMKMDVLNVYIIFYLFYILQRIIYIALNLRFFKFKKIDILEFLGIALFVMLIVSALVNGVVNSTFIYILGCFLVFLTFIRIDKKYYKTLLCTFVLTIVVCSIMGICDLNNDFMPGFVKNTFPMSLQFFNPNYSAYITIMAILMCIFILSKYKTVAEQIIFWLSFIILNVALFINGCFSAETAMFIGEFILLIYLWIKNKKCPVLVLGCLLISIGSSFIWIKGYSSSNANYMFEALAVIDGKLHTSLVKDVSTFFDKIFHTGIIEKVAGSDGWDRSNLKAKAWAAITSSPKSIIFGQGAGANYDILVHNLVLHTWLEYGIINVLIYASILLVLFIRIFKTKFSSHNLYLFVLMVCVIVVCHYFGCLDPYSFTYYLCFLAVFAQDANGKLKGGANSSKSSLKFLEENQQNQDLNSDKVEELVSQDLNLGNSEIIEEISEEKTEKSTREISKKTAKNGTKKPRKTIAGNKGKYYEFKDFGK